jgi:hypothetical protein
MHTPRTRKIHPHTLRHTGKGTYEKLNTLHPYTSTYGSQTTGVPYGLKIIEDRDSIP